MKKYITFFCCLLLIIGNTNAQIKNLNEYFKSVDKFLFANVKSGKVNYKGINADKKDLDALVTYVSKTKI